MNKNFSFVIGQAAALSIAVETIVFAFTLIWEVINQSHEGGFKNATIFDSFTFYGITFST